jgi:hypothetical protein
VTFLHTNVAMGTAPLVNGVATFTTSAVTADNTAGHGIIAVYTGSSTDAESVSPTLVQEVNP